MERKLVDYQADPYKGVQISTSPAKRDTPSLLDARTNSLFPVGANNLDLETSGFRSQLAPDLKDIAAKDTSINLTRASSLEKWDWRIVLGVHQWVRAREALYLTQVEMADLPRPGY